MLSPNRVELDVVFCRGHIVIDKLIRLVRISCVIFIAAACTEQGDNEVPVERSIGEIIKLTGDLYEARTSFHNTVFLVTTDGIILADPISEEFAEWLKAEFAERFGSTVKYVIYSHHHPDHASGGTVFADTATFVGHEQVAAALGEPFPRDAAEFDLNGDGRLSRAEATDHAYPSHFDQYDRNGDGYITGAEINAKTPPPDIIYSEHMTITLGDSRVELMHPGSAHSEDITVLLFPEQRAVFGVDFLHVRRFPSTLYGYPVAKYVDAIAKVQALDFDILIPGHGDVGDKADLVQFLDFLRALDAGVANGIAEGKSLDELRENLFFPGYEDWLLYDERRVNLINETYELLAGP